MVDLSSGMFRDAAKRDFISSDLCSSLAVRIAEDAAILDVARAANTGTFPPYLLIAAVHSLVLECPECELARFFPTVSGCPVPNEDPFPVFKAFVLKHRESIELIIGSAHVNKTVLKRSACLRALLAHVTQQNRWEQIHLVDIGCGAGLNLLMDQWRISYGSLGSVGPEDSPVQFSIDVREGVPPLADLPMILSRIGIDLDRFDLEDPIQERWLLGCLFPDQPEYFALTKTALRCLRKMPPRFVKGNAEIELSGVLEGLPEGEPVVVMHSLTLHQLKPQQKASLSRAIQVAGLNRPVVRIGMEILGGETTLMVAESGAASPQTLGAAEYDASWMRWNNVE